MSQRVFQKRHTNLALAQPRGMHGCARSALLLKNNALAKINMKFHV